MELITIGCSHVDPTPHKCGLGGVNGSRLAAVACRILGTEVQHRGQDYSQVAQDGEFYGGRGFIDQVVPPPDKLQQLLPGNSAIVHTRYATSGGGSRRNRQPFAILVRGKWLLVAHNGNIPNFKKLTKGLPKVPKSFGSSDTAFLTWRIAAELEETGDLIMAIFHSLKDADGAFSLVISYGEQMAAVCDPRGIRPITIAQFGETFVVASESSAIDALQEQMAWPQPTKMREVGRGEIIISEPGKELKCVNPRSSGGC